MDAIRRELAAEAQRVLDEDIAINRAIGRHGAALGVIRAAIEGGNPVTVFANETRPFLQGARLTVWELQQDNIPVTLLTDNMAGHLLHSGKIGAVVVGADRIAGNGDVANKIGTYSVAVLAKENGVPFYVAAPISTLDLSLASGDEIPIEQRDPAEVTRLQGVQVAPPHTTAMHPAFDVTPNRYVSAIITEQGVARAPYVESLRGLAEKSPA
jgi:methylthioribose-1-phosphate isomerase